LFFLNEFYRVGLVALAKDIEFINELKTIYYQIKLIDAFVIVFVRA